MQNPPLCHHSGEKPSLPTVRGAMSPLHKVGETVSFSCHLCSERPDFLAEIRCKWQLLYFRNASSDLIRIFGFTQIYSEFSHTASAQLWYCVPYY